MNIFFRVDASSQIGSGHVIRCLTLAKVLEKHGANCKFICRDHQNNFNEKIRKENFEIMALPYLNKLKSIRRTKNVVSDYSKWIGASWNDDAKQTIDILKKEKIDWLIVDHYGLDKKWEKKLRPYTKKIMVIDDFLDREHDCDLFLNQNLISNKVKFKKNLPHDCVTLLGPDYALLQPSYRKLHKTTAARSGPIKRVLIYFGGTDCGELIKTTILSFIKLKKQELFLDIVLNQKTKNLNEIETLAKFNKKIKIYFEMRSLDNLISRADLSIGAGGVTSWERCCLGLYTLVVTLEKNQILIAKALQKKKLAKWIGDIEHINQKKIVSALKEVFKNDISKLSDNCKQITDGNGTRKVSAIISLNSDIKLKARLAKIEDKDLVFNWANDPLVRKNALDKKKISKLKHSRWFSSRIFNLSKFNIFIVETIDELPVGQVRFEKKRNQWIVSYSIANYARGKGLGTKLLKTAIRVFGRNGQFKIIGYVKKNNFKSCKIFEKLGFKSIKYKNNNIKIFKLI